MPASAPTPSVKIGRIGLAADGSAWDLMTSHKIGAVGGELTMGPAVPVNAGDILTQGYWVIAPNGNANCVLVDSDGTATSPAAGNAYLLTVS